jgi:hypothetical protein
MEIAKEETLNPWLSMWMQPRATIQQIVDSNPERLVLVLAAIAGISRVLNRASLKSLGDIIEWPLIFLIAAILGPVAGIIGLYIGGALIHWTGKWIGGKGSPENIRAAIAWSSIPVIWALLLWIPEFALFGEELFTTKMPTILASPSLTLLLFGFGIIELVIGIWTIVVSLKCIGQVQGFSAWKALGNMALSALVILIPIILFTFGVILLIKMLG